MEGRQEQPPEGPVVFFTDGAWVACSKPPTVAFGMVVYTTVEGVRHAVQVDRVDLERTREHSRRARSRRPTAGLDGEQRRAAPDFEARTADGKAVRLSDLRGRVVLIDFWASWCGPCLRDFPELKRIAEAHVGDDFALLGVSLDRDRKAFESTVERRGLSWPHHFDGRQWSNAVAQAYSVRSIPRTVLVDREGRIARTGLRGRALERAIEELVAEGS